MANNGACGVAMHALFVTSSEITCDEQRPENSEESAIVQAAKYGCEESTEPKGKTEPENLQRLGATQERKPSRRIGKDSNNSPVDAIAFIALTNV